MSDEVKEPTKFTDEELNQINEVRLKYAEVVNHLGQLQLNKRLLEKEIENTLERYDELVATEAELVDALQKKYGAGTLNPQTGEFTPSV